VCRMTAGKMTQKTFPYGKKSKEEARTAAEEYITSLTGIVVVKSGYAPLPEDSVLRSGKIITL